MRGFNGTTSKIEFTLADHIVYSAFAVVRVDATGDSSFPRVLQVSASTTHPIGLELTTANDFSFRHQWTTSKYQGATDTDTLVIGTTHRVCFTYDSGSTSNEAICYLDGAIPTFTRSTAPTGTRQATSGTAVIGNNAGQLRTLDGAIAEFAWWNRLLTDGEGLALTKGFCPLFFPKGLVHYIPLIGNELIDIVGGVALTNTSTTVEAHPRIIRPSAQILQFPPSNNPIITDVDTDETWDDGDTGLIVTGTGFV